MEYDAPVEIEIKMALPDEAAYERLRGLLGPPLRSVQQENRFLDGPDGELMSRRAVLRLRREQELLPDAGSSAAPGSARVLLTLKTEGQVNGAVHSRGEVEAEVTAGPVDSRSDPDSLMTLDLEPVRALRRMAPSLQSLADQGGFSNYREVFAPPAGAALLSDSLWELDRTEFPGGIVEYELEVELRQPGPDRPGFSQGAAGEGDRETEMQQIRVGGAGHRAKTGKSCAGGGTVLPAEEEVYQLLRSWNVPAAAQRMSKFQRWLSYSSAHRGGQNRSAGETEDDLHSGGVG